MDWRNYDKDPLSREEIEKLIGDRDLKPFLNPRSGPYFNLGLKDKTVTKKEAVELMLEDMNLLKRPLLIRGKKYVFGFKEAEWDEVLR